jgi:hypothetical protein
MPELLVSESSGKFLKFQQVPISSDKFHKVPNANPA